MNDETIKTLCWLVAILFTVQAFTFYAIAHLAVTGRAVMPKRQHDEDSGKVLWRGER